MALKPTSAQDPGWLAMSGHHGTANTGALDDMVPCGSFVLELKPPRDGVSVLLDYKTNDGWPRAFSIFFDSNAGLILLHRQADTILRHHLPGPLPRDWALAFLTFTWDGPARTWALQLEDRASGWRHQSHGINPMPMAGADILALCSGQNVTRMDASVQWFGISLQQPCLDYSPWIGKRSLVQTARGAVAAEDLRTGEMILTDDRGAQPLRALHHVAQPNRGRHAAVRLRAPYFARRSDLLVSPGQLTLMSGASVEYLFGHEAVLVAASALRDGNSALSDLRRPVNTGISLDLGQPGLITVDGCSLWCGPTDAELPHPILQDYEALPLLSILGRVGQRAAA